ncbi:hypothetical protein [Rosistilla oblonga]|uniref:hypothetical protein n=1 Tax=Rosistilla oblonga TaxID=2527990 RepID=UPI003A97BD1C
MTDKKTPTTGDYSNGWEPEQQLQDAAETMLRAIFDPSVSTEDKERAASTLVEIVAPEIMRDSLRGVYHHDIDSPPSGVEVIAAERERQVEVGGWTAEHDDAKKKGELANAAACYAMERRDRDRVIWDSPSRVILWPWHSALWKPNPLNRIRELAKAGALIAAEIDRLNRIGQRKDQQ